MYRGHEDAVGEIPEFTEVPQIIQNMRDEVVERVEEERITSGNNWHRSFLTQITLLIGWLEAAEKHSYIDEEKAPQIKAELVAFSEAIQSEMEYSPDIVPPPEVTNPLYEKFEGYADHVLAAMELSEADFSE